MQLSKALHEILCYKGKPRNLFFSFKLQKEKKKGARPETFNSYSFAPLNYFF